MARKLQADKWLFAATAGLALFGIVMVYSASAVMAQEENGNQYHYVVKQGVWTAIGFGAMLLMMQFDYQRLRDRRIVYGLLGVTTLLLLAVFAFPRINGAHRWIRLAGFSIQPSELSKIALAIFLAYFLEKRAGEEGSLWRTFVPCVAVTGALSALILKEPDLGTAMMLAVICVVMCFTAGARLLHLGMAAAPGLLIGVWMLLFVPWRFQRLVTFANPWADPQNTGFQVVQSLIAIGSGGTGGLGFAQGKQKMFFLPFAHSDFIFAVVGEELGLFGALMVLGVFAILLWRGVRVALRAPDRFGMLLALGLVAAVIVQALFNISVVLSLLPTKGIPLPFISYGGSSLVPTLVAMGILLNISQHSAREAGTAGVFDIKAGPEVEAPRRAAPAPALSPRSPVTVSTRRG